MIKYEYRLFKSLYSASQDNETINSLGAQGWELVSVAGSGASLVYAFKRPL
jgi:hypothetical protein